MQKRSAEISRDIIQNSATLIAARIGTKLATTFLIIYVARTVGEVSFGIFSSILALVALYGLLIDFGLTVPLIRRLAQGTAEPGMAVGKVLATKTPLGIASAALFMITSIILGLPVLLSFAFAVGMFFEAQVLTSIRSFEGFERMDRVATLTVVERLIYCVGGFAVIWGGAGLFGLSCIYLLSNSITLLISVRFFQRLYGRLRIHFSFRESGILLREALPFFTAGLFSVLYNKADVFILTIHRTQAEVGWYNAAGRIIEAQMFIPTAIVASIFPVLSRKYSNDFQAFLRLQRQSAVALFSVGSLITVATYLLAEEIVGLLFTQNFFSSVEILRITSLMLPFFFANFSFGSALIACGKERWSAATLAIGSVVNVLVNLYFIPNYGAKGAAVVRVMTEIIAFSFQGYVLRHAGKLPPSQSTTDREKL